MKKGAAEKPAAAKANARHSHEPAGRLKDHEHIHAANCGHRSWVHGDHIDFEHDGHFHYVQDGKTFECTGPHAQVLPFRKK